MADQSLRDDIGEFRIDLHGTEVRVAKIAVRRRIEECYRYGVRVLKIVYGTPDDFDRSIAKEVHRIVRTSDLVVQEMLPTYVQWDWAPEKLRPVLNVYLRSNPAPTPMTEDASFAPFTPIHEHDIAKRLRCRTAYFPKRRLHEIDWAVHAIGNGCTRDVLFAIIQEPRIERLMIEPGKLSWDALCLAAEAYNRRKAKYSKRRKYRTKSEHRHITADGDISAPARESSAAFPVDPSQLAFEDICMAKALSLDSKYEEAERLLLPLAAASENAAEIVEQALLELGRVYLALGRPESEGALKRALELTTKRLGRGIHLFTILELLETVYLCSADYDSVLKLSEDYADIRTELEAEEILPAILRYARLLFLAGQYERSLEALKEFSYQKGTTPLSAGVDAQRYDLLSMIYSRCRDLFLARLASGCALQCCDLGHDECEELRPRVLTHLGVVQSRSGRHIDAIETYKGAAALLRRLGDSHSIGFAEIMSSMGVAYRRIGDLDKADTCYREAVEIHKKTGQTETPEFARTLSSIAVLRMFQKRYDEAETLLDEASDLYALKSSGDIDSQVNIHTHRGQLYQSKGDLELAQVALEEAVELAEQKLGCDSIGSAEARTALGDCLLVKGNCDRAIPLYQEALNVFETIEGCDSYEALQLREKLRIVKDGCHADAQCSSAKNEEASFHSEIVEMNNDLAPRKSLAEAANAFAKTSRSGTLRKAFSLAVSGQIDDAVDEFEDAELDGEFDPATYRDFAMIMFIYGRFGRAFNYAKSAQGRDPGFQLPHPLRALNLECFAAFDFETGGINRGFFESFEALRSEYLRSRGFSN